LHGRLDLCVVTASINGNPIQIGYCCD